MVGGVPPIMLHRGEVNGNADVNSRTGGEEVLSMLRAAGLDEAGMKNWHVGFEKSSPDAHQGFLESIGIGQQEITPLDFISKLVALVPKPRVNLTRFHGVFAPNSKYRAWVTPARRGKRKKSHPVIQTDQTAAEERASITWARRLKRVFNIDKVN